MQRVWQTVVSASKGPAQRHGLRSFVAGSRVLCEIDKVPLRPANSCFRLIEPRYLSHQFPNSRPGAVSVQQLSSLPASSTKQATSHQICNPYTSMFPRPKCTIPAALGKGRLYASQSRAMMPQTAKLPGRDAKQSIVATQRRSLSFMGGGGSQWNSSWWWNENLMYVIIGTNIVVFVLWQNVRLQRLMNDNFTISTRGILQEGRLHTIITCLFSHTDPIHLLANMVTLWFFGSEAVMLLGAQRFLNLFMFGGITASICQVVWPLVARQLPIPAQFRTSPFQQGLGASGAINAVVAYSILTFPSRTVLLYMFLPVPAALLGALFLAKDVSGLYYGDSRYGNAAHLGGSVFGLVFWLRFRSLHRRW